MSQPGPHKKPPFRMLVMLLWLVALAALGATAAVALVSRDRIPAATLVPARTADDLPVLATVPDFTMTNRDGRTVTRDDLRGQPWVADFIFTNCKAICPIMTLRMAEVQSSLDSAPIFKDVKLVSISVDPEHDTPAAMAEFAERYDAHPERWLFLTGEAQETVWTLVQEGFQLPLDATPDNAAMPISHSSRFVLVDAHGRIRGYYSSTDGQDDLLEDLATLIAAGE